MISFAKEKQERSIQTIYSAQAEQTLNGANILPSDIKLHLITNTRFIAKHIFYLFTNLFTHKTLHAF